MIKIDIGNCTGCRCCETACSFYHTGQINRSKSRIKVVHQYETGVDGPVVCRQCKERYCLECDEKAITVGALGQIKISYNLCNLCKKCVKNCPIGAIELFDEYIFVCDLCGGSPKCVEACTEKAILYAPEESDAVSLEERKKESKKLNVSERRTNFIDKLGINLRQEWRG